MKLAFPLFKTSAIRRVIMAWAFALLAGFGLVIVGIGGELEQQLKDNRADLLKKPATGDIVLVEIDAKSLQALDRWPWPRDYYAQLVKKLNAAGAAQIAFDVDFSAHSDPTQDRIFADAIAKSDATVILPTFRQKGSSEESFYVESLPIEELRENAFLASVNVHPDKHGMLNRYSFGTITGGTARPSLASMIAEISGNIDRDFVIDQTIDPATIPRVSFVDLMGTGPLTPELSARLSGAKILIGATAIELGDRYPISRFGVLPGVVIQAMATETLVQGTGIYSLGKYPPLLCAAILLFGIILVRKSSESTVTWLTCGVGILLYTGLLAAEYSHVFTFSTVPAFFFLGTFLVLRKLFTTALELNRSQFFNETSRLPNYAAMLKSLKTKKDNNIATARLSNYHELLVVTDKPARMEMFNSLADRLKFLARDEHVYHVGTDIIAWVMKDDYDDDIDGHFETANVLFQSPVIAGATKLKINATFGVSSETIDKSIVASEQAAATGKRWLSHDDGVDQAIGQKLNILMELDQAIQNKNLGVVYQPKWNLRDDRLNGAEALVRWSHPEQGMISPAIFIPMLEKAGRIDELTLFVLQQALHDLAQWNEQGTDLTCSINISAQLLGDSKFVEKAISMVETSDVNNSQITFEVTETAALADPELSILALNRIRDAGIKISIDDYGTGQSTMSYLQRLPIHEIKIDQSFIKTMMTENTNRVMVKSTIEMAHALGFKIVAEGIEDQQCMDFLKKHGCDIGQGWHISKPVASKVFAADWLAGELNHLSKTG